MEPILARELEVGQTVVNVGGDKYTVGKVGKDGMGRIEVRDTNLRLRNVSGKRVIFQLV